MQLTSSAMNIHSLATSWYRSHTTIYLVRRRLGDDTRVLKISYYYLFAIRAHIISCAKTSRICSFLEVSVHYTELIGTQRYVSVASLGWVTPGAATEGVLKNQATFFAHRCHYHYRFLLLSLRCHPLQGGVCYLFYMSDLVSPLFFVNLPTKFFSFGCHPWCHPGRPPRIP